MFAFDRRERSGRDGRCGIEPDVPFPNLRRVAADAGEFGMGAHPGLQLEHPLVPRACHRATVDGAAGEVAAGVGTGVVEGDDSAPVVEKEHREFAAVEFDEGAAVVPTAIDWDELNVGHLRRRLTFTEKPGHFDSHPIRPRKKHQRTDPRSGG